ncbi:hypothetical protein GGG16DRAFT_107000 [Schizophyllum commune]
MLRCMTPPLALPMHRAHIPVHDPARRSHAPHCVAERHPTHRALPQVRKRAPRQKPSSRRGQPRDHARALAVKMLERARRGDEGERDGDTCGANVQGASSGSMYGRVTYLVLSSASAQLVCPEPPPARDLPRPVLAPPRYIAYSECRQCRIARTSKTTADRGHEDTCATWTCHVTQRRASRTRQLRRACEDHPRAQYRGMWRCGWGGGWSGLSRGGGGGGGGEGSVEIIGEKDGAAWQPTRVERTGRW